MQKKEYMILGLMLLGTTYGFYEYDEILGNVIKENNLDKMEIVSSLEIEEYAFFIKNKDVEVVSNLEYSIEIGDVLLDLEKSKVKLVNFNGILSYNGQFKLKGEVDKMIKEDGYVRVVEEIIVLLDDAFLDFKVEDVDFNSFSSKGLVIINDEHNLNLKDSRLDLKKFSGNVKIENNGVFFKGNVESFKIIDEIEVEFK